MVDASGVGHRMVLASKLQVVVAGEDNQDIPQVELEVLAGQVFHLVFLPYNLLLVAMSPPSSEGKEVQQEILEVVQDAGD